MIGKSGFKHNRKRNSGLVYEFLLRKLSDQAISKDASGARRTYEIIRRYFGKGSPMARETEIFDVVVRNRAMSEAVCRKFLCEIQGKIRSLNRRLIDIKKSNLIKEVNYGFGRDFFSEYRVPDYRLYASIQMYIDGLDQKRTLGESRDMLQIEEALVTHMMSSGAEERHIMRSGVDSLVCGLALKKFGERYSEVLGDRQKATLQEYVKRTLSSDNEGLQRLVIKESQRLLSVITKARSLKEIFDDKVMADRLESAILKLESFKYDRHEESIRDILLFQKLEEELSSDEK